MTRRLLLLVALAALAAGCGAASKSPTAPSSTSTSAAPPLQGEANSAAAGDIPDNQVFLVFRNSKAGYSMKYPEGWAQQGSGNQVVFRDKNNIVRVVVGRGAVPTTSSVQSDLASQASLKIT